MERDTALTDQDIRTIWPDRKGAGKALAVEDPDKREADVDETDEVDTDTTDTDTDTTDSDSDTTDSDTDQTDTA